jgi:DNA-binding transcriptional LysR family regulator
MNARPPLTALQAFVSVAEMGSVREAARHLNVGHSVVARHLKTLQNWAGCPLVETTQSGARLTEEGRMMFAAAGPAFTAISRLGEEFRPRPSDIPLELWCAPGLASRWLASRLDGLTEALGGRQILIRPIDRIADLARGECDAVITYGTQSAVAGCIVTPLCRPNFFPVASQSFVALNSVSGERGDLRASTLIHEHSDEQWRRWLETVGSSDMGPLPGPRLWYANLALDAAEHGQGLALTNLVLAEEPLSSGRLVRVTDTAAPLDHYHLIVAERRAGDPAIRKLRTWLERELARYEAGT